MNQEEIAAKNLIQHYGSPVSITNYYQVTKDCNLGDTELELNSTFGLNPGLNLVVDTETVQISLIVGPKVTLKDPVSVSHKTDTVAYTILETLGKSVARSTGRTRAEDEYSDKIRVSVDTPVSNGSYLLYDDRNFLVAGVDKGSNSLRLLLQETNVVFSIIDPNNETYNGFGYDLKDEVLATSLPGYLQFLNANLTPEDAGQTLSTRRHLIYPSAFVYNKDLIYVMNSKRFRVVDLAELTMKNLHVVILDYDIKS